MERLLKNIYKQLEYVYNNKIQRPKKVKILLKWSSAVVVFMVILIELNNLLFTNNLQN